MGCKMKYELVFSKEFDKNFSKLDKTNQAVVLKKMVILQNNPLIGKPLRFGLKGFRSLRVGKYRIIYKINDKILLSTLKHRKNVYD
jgi:mRNA interferase RelE/StbE